MNDSSLCSNDIHIINTYREEPRRRFTTVVKSDVQDHKKRCFTVREKILILIIAFMLIFCVVILNLYLKERTQNQRTELLQSLEYEILYNRTTGHPYTTTASQAFEVCSTQECAQTSSDILDAMDEGADPCLDFYQYACGGWVARNPIPKGKSRWDHFSRLQLELDQLLTRLLTSQETEAMYAKNEAVVKTLDYYRSCMDTDQINKLGGKPLKDLLTSYGSSPLTSKTWNESAWHFTETFVKIHRDQNALMPFLNIRIESDWENSSKYIMIIDKASTALTSIILQNNSFATRIQNAYKGFMVNISKLMDGENSFLENTEELYQFEKEIAKIVNDLPMTSTMQDCKLISLRRLCAKACKQINWLLILQWLLEGSGHQITEHDEVRICSLEYLRRISRLISKTSKRVLANYLMWRVVQVHYRELSTTYEAVFRNYMNSAFQSPTSIPNTKRKVHCLDKVKNLFGMPLGRMYVDNKLKPESKKMVTKIVDDIRESFRNNLQGLDWMDNGTKKKAIDKVEALLAHVGYPDYIMDNQSLNAKYNNVVIHKKTFFKNQVSYQRHVKRQLFNKLSLPVDRSEWHASPVVVNAYYNDAVNSMIFPASIFQPPFLHLGSSWAVNYGAIGTFVAHELTHGFDDQGRRYDHHGNLAMWWDLQTLLAFRNKTKCLRDQYGNYSYHGFKVKGGSSLSENIADNGAIKQAYQAYRRWIAQNGDEPKLPGVKLSNDQVFFLSFAQIWCASNTKRDARYNYYWGSYAPKPWRVKGSLRNFPEFARSFNCPLGSPMNPKKKCAVW